MTRRQLALLLLGFPTLCHAAPPEVLDDRFALTLFAQHPTVRTPVGCALDGAGRLLVIESHTHFAPDGYDGPKTDRILALSDTDGDGKADKTEVYWEAGEHLMSIAFDPGFEECYVASRSRIFRFRAGTRPGRETEIARLDTPGEYPHNGLAGLALVTGATFTPPVGGIIDTNSSRPEFYFGLGENLGEPYKLIAKDGTTLSGGGEGGNIYRITGDGTGLEKIATGFWNPFGICAMGRQVFTVDNDPDSRPPNRLLHVVRGGDYGYQFRYGRPGTHPLQAWDGEIPGTLPMVCGVGEAACSIIPYGGELLVTSWGHHRIESYAVEPRGNSYGATMKTLVRGGDDFRPVGLCADDGGAIYFTDWVDKSYPVHGKGRVWKLTPKKPVAALPPPLPAIKEAVPNDPFDLTRKAHDSSDGDLADNIRSEKVSAASKAHAISALRFRAVTPEPELLRSALATPSPDVQLAAVRWISDEKTVAVLDDLLALAPRAVDHPRLFDAVAATVRRLDPDGPKFDREAMLLASARNKYLPAAERVAALRRISPDSKKLPVAIYRELLDDPMPSVAEAATWHLTQRRDKDAKPLLEKLAAEGHPDAAVFAGAPPAPAAGPPRDAGAWLALLDIGGADADPANGRRVFFASHLGMCARCHTHDGYGKAVGPDLTGIGARVELPELIESIVHPNQEIAPMFRPEIIEKNDGELVVGLPVKTTGRHGTGAEELIGVDGNSFEIALSDIKARRPWIASLMPAGLDTRLTEQQMRDLIAFLKTTP